ncbi:MAG: hypothetical protein H3C35_06225 [Bacteroidetes bacterium]|nr:hypothetical protein [Bacteroidota bacterium]
MKKYVLLVCSLILFGCSKESPADSSNELPANTKGVFILNEGGFGKVNASLSLYIPDSHKVYQNIFETANNRSLGDVANDMILFDNKGYIVVQNSDKVEVVSLETKKSLGVMSLPGKTPNKILIISTSKGYITNLYKQSVTAFNPSTLAVLKDSIAVGNNPQSMAYVNGKVYVCNSGYGSDNTVSVINPTNDSVVKAIVTAAGPSEIGVDKNGKVIILCTGYSDWSNSANDTPGNISIVDPAVDSVVQTIPFSLSQYGHPMKMSLSTSGDGFTFTNKGITKFNTTSGTITAESYIPKNGYTLKVDNDNGELYVGDAMDFVQNGLMYRYSKQGNLQDSMTVGIIPGTIVIAK